MRAATALLQDRHLARLVTGITWVVAALDITGLLPPTTADAGSHRGLSEITRPHPFNEHGIFRHYPELDAATPGEP